MGGSMIGLSAAAVLSRYFDRVTVLERDTLSPDTEERKGIPQGRHVHGVLQAGAEVLEQLFPGFWREMLEAGSVSARMGQDWRWFHQGRWKSRQPLDLVFYLQSRPFLEKHVRRRVSSIPNVRLRSGCRVQDLLFDADNRAVAGVLARQGDRNVPIYADFVVDCTGRGTRSPKWLSRSGYERPRVEQVKIDVVYCSCIVRPPEMDRDWKVLLMSPDGPKNKRVGIVSPIEGNRWLVCLGGYHGDHPGSKYEDFLEFSRQLPRPNIHEALRNCKPLTPIVRYKLASEQWNRYDEMSSFPKRYAILGDAVGSFNPIFGQGMSVGLLGVQALDKRLEHARGVDDLYPRLMGEIREVVTTAWKLSTSEDMRYPETVGNRPIGFGMQSWYFKQVTAMSTVDVSLAKQFLMVMNFKKPPSALLSFGLIMRLVSWRFRQLFLRQTPEQAVGRAMAK